MMQFEFETKLQGIHSVAIAGHIRPDGDSVGACVGLWNYINDNFPQIKADIYLEKPSPKFTMLEGFEQICQADGTEKIYDVFISVDCAAIDRLGEASKYFQSAKQTICIDHHISNVGFAKENIILPDASSTCEVLCMMMKEELISRATASALYLGMVHDTGVFQYSCTSPLTMRMAAMLMEKEIPYTKIIEETYYKKTYSQNQALGKSLLGSMRILDGKGIISVMRKKEMDFLCVGPMDLDGIVSQMKLTEGVEVAIFLYEIGNHEYKVSLRSSENVDVSEVASYFGGGGHKRAAGVTMQGTFHDIINNLTLHIEGQLLEQK